MLSQFVYNATLELGNEITNLNLTEFEYNSQNIFCDDLPLPGTEGNIYNYHTLKDFFDKLEIEKGTPYIYWFKIKNDICCDDIRKLVQKYNIEVQTEVSKRIQHTDRKYFGVPAMTKSIKDPNSKILYVGKVKSNLKGRLVPHLGYYQRSPNTQGLQLARWAKGTNLQLEFNYIKLPKQLKELGAYLEFKLAAQLKPILGRHKG